MRRVIVILLLLAASAAGATAVARTPPEATPTLRVELHPFTGAIPATLANGRPVYRFHAAVVHENRRVLFASAETLLQAAMTREIGFGNPSSGEIRGAVTIRTDGSAEYFVRFSRGGNVLVETSSSVVLPGSTLSIRHSPNTVEVH